VQDKLFLPGLKKLAFLRDPASSVVCSVRGEFGYWVFEGDWQERSGRHGITAAKTAAASFSTWSATGATLLDNLFAVSVSCLGTTDIPERWDEKGAEVPGDGGRFRLRPPAQGRRDRAYQHVLGDAGLSRRSRHLQVDGTHGSAVAGLSDCVIQARQRRRGRCGIPMRSAPTISMPTGRPSRTPSTTAAKGGGRR
jgi:hypothetical protein